LNYILLYYLKAGHSSGDRARFSIVQRFIGTSVQSRCNWRQTGQVIPVNSCGGNTSATNSVSLQRDDVHTSFHSTYVITQPLAPLNLLQQCVTFLSNWAAADW